MESRAILRFSGLSARKMRQVADLVRGKDVAVALHSLQFVTKAAAKPMSKLISSALANAKEKNSDAAEQQRFDADRYFVKTVIVDEGPTTKRFRPRAQGRAYRIRKRSCHVNLVLDAHAEDVVRRKPAAASVVAASETTPEAKKSGRGKKQKAAAGAK